jgi:hypothetical protein
MTSDGAIEIEPRDAELMFLLLSLDVTRKLYPLIGLPIEDAAGLTQAIRDALGEEVMADSPQPRVEQVFATIRQRLGSAAADAVRQWAGVAFYHAYRAKHVYGYWIALLAQARWQTELRDALSLPANRRETVMAHFLSAQDEESFDTAYEQAAAAPLSDWDLRMRLNDAFHDSDSDTSGSEILLRSLASVERNRRFWQWVVRTLTPGELDAMHASARALAKGTPQFAFIEELRHPAAIAFADGRRG